MHVDEGQRGLLGHADPDGRVAILGLARHDEVGLIREARRDATPEHGVIVGDEGPDDPVGLARFWSFQRGVPLASVQRASSFGRPSIGWGPRAAPPGYPRRPSTTGIRSYTRRVVRAAILERPGDPLTIGEVTLDPPASGEVRVRMTASGVCHSDLHVRDGEWPRPGPFVIGHEGAGVVTAARARTWTRRRPGCAPESPSR